VKSNRIFETKGISRHYRSSGAPAIRQSTQEEITQEKSCKKKVSSEQTKTPNKR
jgi:hypothetical protein